MQSRLIDILWMALAVSAAPCAWSQAPFDPPPAQVLTEARALVQGMIANPRGPYSRIRWFCNDGTVQPPVSYGCAEHGGGRQHAEYSAERARLAELGWPVGTVFAALDWDEIWDAERRHRRLRDLSLERYLTDIDDGWVLRRARGYRGRVQVEAEEAAGRALLLKLLDDRDWLEANYLLARESVRVIPHRGGAEDRTRDVRRDAIEIAERDASFEQLRVEIHNSPSPTTAARVRAWSTDRADETRERGRALADALDALYGAAGRTARLATQRRVLAAREDTASIAERLSFEDSLPARQRLARICAALRAARDAILSRTTPATRLLLFDVMGDLESELTLTSAEALGREDLSRGELLALAADLIDAGFGSGMLTAGELGHLTGIGEAVAADAVSMEDYRELVAYLRRVPQWAVGSVRYAFAESLIRYTALDARASGFTDDVLRGSALVGVAEIARRLSRDFARLTGVSQSVGGEAGVAAFGLNPGIAIGPLKLFETQEQLEHGDYARTDIVVLPETVAELSPVGGIVTLGEGSPLSHVQLLARNFGIPNIAIAPALLPRLWPLAGGEVLAAVASDGSLVLASSADLDDDLRAALRPANEHGARLTVPLPDLSVRDPIPLAMLNAGLSGRVVGPKAANLGELARLFPGHVAPAVAVPFGIFAAHLAAGTGNLRTRLGAAYAARRAGTLGADELLTELASIRAGIAALELSPETRAALLASMAEAFGPSGTYGMFVRSDTNVEDLPEFTGAGLSETIPNVVGSETAFAAVSRVWASVLSPRAIAWRSDLLTNPETVYASVLLMKSVPSDKSGVMVTADLTAQARGLTVSTAWGVGGAVGGEAAETVVLRPNGTEVLVSEAKTAYRRALDPAGGLRWEPAADGAVLTDGEKVRLRELAAEVLQRYRAALDAQGRPRPWDIEFGFVDGELALFQIRPLVERGQQLADRVVRALVGRPDRAPPDRVMLSEPPQFQ